MHKMIIIDMVSGIDFCQNHIISIMIIKWGGNYFFEYTRTSIKIRYVSD